VINSKLEMLLWSIALPGFGQLLNKKYIIGIVLLLLEITVNIQSNLNEVIVLSFQGDISTAVEKTNYQWLMFYPCLYFFAMWDAFKDAKGETPDFSFLPFIFSAFFMTVGVIYSSKLELLGVLLGPVFLPLLSIIPGLLVGFSLIKVIKHSTVK
jgi:hypothetical protein